MFVYADDLFYGERFMPRSDEMDQTDETPMYSGKYRETRYTCGECE
jgi:hypothetical protein